MLTVITCCMYLTSSFTSKEPLDQWCSSTTRLCQDVEVLESTIPSSGLGGRATPSVARTRVIWDKYFGMSVLHPLRHCKHTTIPMFLMRRADHPLRATTVAREGFRILAGAGCQWTSIRAALRRRSSILLDREPRHAPTSAVYTATKGSVHAVTQVLSK